MPISEYLKTLREKIGHEMVMMPGVTAVVINDAGEILLHRSQDDGRWYLIGGGMDPGEDPAESAVREVWEETGVQVIVEALIGVYAEPLVRYPNGDEILYTAMSFRCRPVSGTPHVHDEESLEVRYFSVTELPDLSKNDRHRIEYALSNAGNAPNVYFRFTNPEFKAGH